MIRSYVVADQFRSLDAHGWRLQRPAEVEHLLARKQAVVGGFVKRVASEDGTDAAYDLRSDPGEERPFPGSEAPFTARVPEPDAAATPVILDAVPRKMLEVLGYLQ